MAAYQLDGRRMDTRAAAHAYLQAALNLPDHYGKNLDALFDCLSERSGLRIEITYAQAMRNALGHYGDKLIKVMRDAGAAIVVK